MGGGGGRDDGLGGDRLWAARRGAGDPLRPLCGILLGLVNGFGVAYLRIPSMIITLAVNAVARGLMVAYTGGFSPQDSASAAMRFIGAGTVATAASASRTP